MKSTIQSAALFGAVSLLVACGGEENSDHSVDINYHNIKATLQGTAFNSVDGKRITDDSFKVTLVQGTSYRKASVRTGEKDFAGDYAISGIPASTANNNTYRIVATADGYQTFETSIAISVNTDDLQDRSANLFANMYMYPLGSSASDVQVNVTFNNESVPNATVLLNPTTATNSPTTDTNNILLPDNGFQQALTAVTDASGSVTFSAENLVLGGRYTINVLPTTYEGSQLALSGSTTINVGTSANISNIAMSETVPGSDNGLYVTSASNFNTSSVTASGALTLGFSRSVSLVDERNVTAGLAGDVVNAVLDTSTNPDSTVNATLSADGKTLTLTPVFTTAPVNFNGVDNEATADDNLVVNYSNVYVRIAEPNDTAVIYDVFALTAETGGNPDNSVQTTVDFN